MIIAAPSGLRREENGLSQCRRASLSSFTANCSRSDSFDQASQLRQAASKCHLVNLREENGVVQHCRASQRREWIVAASSSFSFGRWFWLVYAVWSGGRREWRGVAAEKRMDRVSPKFGWKF
ncbi:hypothetical protein AAC387_Pa05g1357 [Persea americana]